jgi:hypothetical protein
MGANQNYSQELGLYPKLENRTGPQPWEKWTSPGERHEQTSPQPWEKRTSPGERHERTSPRPWEKWTSPGERHERTSPQPWKKRTSKSNLENLGLRAGNGQGQTGPVQIEGGPKTLRGGKPDQYRGTDQAGAAWRKREEKYPVAKIKLHFRLK